MPPALLHTSHMFERPDSGHLTVAQLTGAALRHARWRAPAPDELAGAVAELQSIAGGRGDLLAGAAGLLRGFGQGSLYEVLDGNAARLLIAAGAGESAIGRAVTEGLTRNLHCRFQAGTCSGGGGYPRSPVYIAYSGRPGAWRGFKSAPRRSGVPRGSRPGRRGSLSPRHGGVAGEVQWWRLPSLGRGYSGRRAHCLAAGLDLHRLA
jgi:hypothetical protein